MKRGALLVVSAFLLGACALPVPVQLASWALDGISLIATHKSIADHGLSLVANKDCAMWRAIEGKSICTSNDAGVTPVAVATNETTANKLANFETAAGAKATTSGSNGHLAVKGDNNVFDSPPPVHKTQAQDKPVLSDNLAPDPSEFVDAWAYITRSSPPPETPALTETNQPSRITTDKPRLIKVAYATGATARAAGDSSGITAWFPIYMPPKDGLAHGLGPPATMDRAKVAAPAWFPIYMPPKTAAVSDKALTVIKQTPAKEVSYGDNVEGKSGFYFVIGSFSRRGKAFNLAAEHSLLRPKIAFSMMDGSEINRVVVGPFPPGKKEAVHNLVIKDGIFDAWATRINFAKWSLIAPTKTGDLALLVQ